MVLLKSDLVAIEAFITKTFHLFMIKKSKKAACSIGYRKNNMIEAIFPIYLA